MSERGMDAHNEDKAESILSRIEQMCDDANRGIWAPRDISKMKISSWECGEIIRTGLSKIVADNVESGDIFIDFALKIPVWYTSVTGFENGKESAKAIEDSLHKSFFTTEYRCVAYTWSNIARILITGIDVVPTTSMIYSGHFAKALEYGGWPKIVLMLDNKKLKPTMVRLDKDASKEQIDLAKMIYPYERKDRNGYCWLSLNDIEQSRFSSYESEYGRWIPGDAREALQGVIILDDALPAVCGYEQFRARLDDLLTGKVESTEAYAAMKKREYMQKIRKDSGHHD